MNGKDLPAVSMPTDSTKLDAVPLAPAPRKPGSELRKALPEARRPGTEVRKAPTPLPAAATPAPKAAPAPAPRPAAAPAPESDDESEKLLREYAERQKSQLKKVAAERDAVRVKAEELARELVDARRQLEAAAKFDAVIKDLQGKLDAALLSNTMLTDENGKLKARLQETSAAQKKFEERAAHGEKSLAEAQKALASQSDARKEADAKITAALHALQGEAPAPRRAAPPAAPKAEAPVPVRK